MHAEEVPREEEYALPMPSMHDPLLDTASTAATKVSEVYAEFELERRTLSAEELLERVKTRT
jgi:hypothetical protein